MMMPISVAQRDADQADGERDARAVDEAREHVAPEPVGAEQEQRAVLGRADEMEVGRRTRPQKLYSSPEQKKRIGCGSERSATYSRFSVSMLSL